MSFNWVKVEDFYFNFFLLMDRWLIRMICNNYFGWKEFIVNLGIALAYNQVRMTKEQWLKLQYFCRCYQE
jgi:hypothetical protein